MPPLRQIPPQMRFLVSRVFPSFFILAGAVTLVLGGRGFYRARESLTWPVAEGRIQTSSVEYHRGENGGGTYHAEVMYTFIVSGQTHSGNNVAFGDYGSSSPSHAQNIVSRYPKDKVVSVRYRASDPDVCVLEPGIRAQAWFLPGFGLVFVLVGTLMAVFIPRGMKKYEASQQGA